MEQDMPQALPPLLPKVIDSGILRNVATICNIKDECVVNEVEVKNLFVRRRRMLDLRFNVETQTDERELEPIIEPIVVEATEIDLKELEDCLEATNIKKSSKKKNIYSSARHAGGGDEARLTKKKLHINEDCSLTAMLEEACLEEAKVTAKQVRKKKYISLLALQLAAGTEQAKKTKKKLPKKEKDSSIATQIEDDPEQAKLTTKKLQGAGDGAAEAKLTKKKLQGAGDGAAEAKLTKKKLVTKKDNASRTIK